MQVHKLIFHLTCIFDCSAKAKIVFRVINKHWVCAYNIVVLIIYRLDVSLKKIENSHGVSRWNISNPRYIQTAHTLAVKEKSKILQQLYTECSSRQFLLQLRSRYSGRYTMHMNDCQIIMLFSFLCCV